MIRNNLSVLLSERDISNTALSEKTGISKNTISSINQNDVKMIQLETINKICQALEVEPNDFFSYIPFDYSIEERFSLTDPEVGEDFHNFTTQAVDFRIIQSFGLTKETYSYQTYFRQTPFDTEWYDDSYDIFIQGYETDYNQTNRLKTNLLDKLNISFKSDFTRKLEISLSNCLKTLIKNENYDFKKKELTVKVNMDFISFDLIVKL